MPSLDAFAGFRAPRRDREQVVRERMARVPGGVMPEPPAELLEALDRQKLLRLYTSHRDAVVLYIDNRTGAYIKKATGISITKAKRLFERCTEPNPDGSVWGFYKCMPAETDAPPVKHLRNVEARPIDLSLAAEGKGLKGVFTDLLNKNGGRMRKMLDEFFRTRSLEGRPPFPVLSQ